MGEAEPARALGEDTLPRCRRVLGPDHLTTVSAAAALTLALVMVGEAEPARALGEDTLPRCRRVFGPDHPITLLAAAGLTLALVMVGEAEPARALGEDTLPRCRRVFGPDHPITLLAAAALTLALVHGGRGGAGPRPGRGHAAALPPGARPGPPDHAVLDQAASSGHLLLEEDAPEDHPSRPL